MTDFKESIKAIVGMKHSNRYSITASEARARSIYGSPGMRDRFVTDNIESLSIKIKEASGQKKFAIFEKLDPGCKDILTELTEYFKSKGFGVKIVNKGDIPALYDDCYIIIAWKNIKDEEFSSNVPGEREKVLDLQITGNMCHCDSI